MQQCTLCHDPHSPRTFIGAPVAPSHPGNAVAGKGKTESCAGCHGPAGVSAGLPGPTLAAQSEAYLLEVLKAYKTGARKNPMMTPMVASLSDGNLADVAAYYASLKCAAVPADVALIAAARKAGTSVCTNCHGANGIGVNNVGPNLAGQSKAYLAAALRSYADGARSHAVMSALAKSMNDADVEKVATYYASLSCK
jgi:cytochrome c553